jgi:Cdc6-like AAA superfamily ATPase
MKTLLLAQDNQMMKFLLVRRHVGDARIPEFLNRLDDSRNTLQKQAIREALAPEGSMIQLIVGPPGTGKTAVSTAIIEFCFVHKIPILVVCGQNQASKL